MKVISNALLVLALGCWTCASAVAHTLSEGAQKRFCEIQMEPQLTQEFVLREVRDRRLNILFIPGFLGDTLARKAQYFDDSIDFWRSNGVRAGRVLRDPFFGGPWDSELPMRENAANLAGILRGPFPGKKNTLAIGHSNGGRILALTAVEYPDIQEKLFGAAGIQVPFHGSELADWALSLSAPKRWLLGMVLRMMGGKPQILRDMSTPESLRFLYEREKEIAEMLGRFPFVTYGSTIQRADGTEVPSVLAVPLLKQRWAQRLLGLERSPHEIVRDRRNGDPHNDGAVSLRSTQLDGAIQVWGEGVDHMMPVTNNAITGPTEPMDRVALVNSLIRLVIEEHDRR